MTIQADFIYQPTSGRYREKHFQLPDVVFSVQLWSWILFTKSDESQWVASFRGGVNNKRSVATLRDTPFAFIVADGQGYFVNIETEEMIKYSDQDTIRELTNNIDNSLIVFADSWNLFTVDKSLEVRKLEVPFEFYFVWFKQVLSDKIEIEYEEMYTGDFKVTYFDMQRLRFITAEKQSG